MIQHPYFPEDGYLNALFEEQKGHSVLLRLFIQNTGRQVCFLLSLRVFSLPSMKVT